jgi:glycerophosphoryl diester phosphodiesterase
VLGGEIMASARNPWLDRRVYHWAHQGGAREGPSNTLFAMTAALAAGSHGIELDVHRTKDGHLVVLHDADLERTTNGHGKVAEQTLDELRRLDAAYWWVPGTVDDHDPATPPARYTLRGRAPSDGDLRIPTLDDVLDRFAVPLTIEVKAKAAVGPLVDLLRARGRTEGVIVTSFMERVVHQLRRAGPELPLAPGRVYNLWFLARVLVGWPPRRSSYVALQVPRRFRGFTVLSPRLVRGAHRAGMAVHAWTIDEETEMRRLVALGVDGIMTDRPGTLAAVLAEDVGRPGS